VLAIAEYWLDFPLGLEPLLVDDNQKHVWVVADSKFGYKVHKQRLPNTPTMPGKFAGFWN